MGERTYRLGNKGSVQEHPPGSGRLAEGGMSVGHAAHHAVVFLRVRALHPASDRPPQKKSRGSGCVIRTEVYARQKSALQSPGVRGAFLGSKTQRACVVASMLRHVEPRRRGPFHPFRYILTTDQSDAGSAGIFSRRTNQTQEAQTQEAPFGASDQNARGPSRRPRNGHMVSCLCRALPSRGRCYQPSHRPTEHRRTQHEPVEHRPTDHRPTERVGSL
eukprot:1191690-Prorocentrum_minimum.AAC.6